MTESTTLASRLARVKCTEMRALEYVSTGMIHPISYKETAKGLVA